jgi:hypothetical protein
VIGDKRVPCSNCIRASIECVTPESGRASAKTPRRTTGKRAYQERTAALEELVQSFPEARRSMSLDAPIGDSPGSDADVFRKWRKVSHLGHRGLGPLSEAAGLDVASPSIADTHSGQRIQPNIEANLEDLLPESGGGRYINTCLLDVLQVEVSLSGGRNEVYLRSIYSGSQSHIQSQRCK